MVDHFRMLNVDSLVMKGRIIYTVCEVVNSPSFLSCES